MLRVAKTIAERFRSLGLEVIGPTLCHDFDKCIYRMRVETEDEWAFTVFVDVKYNIWTVQGIGYEDQAREMLKLVLSE